MRRNDGCDLPVRHAGGPEQLRNHRALPQQETTGPGTVHPECEEEFRRVTGDRTHRPPRPRAGTTDPTTVTNQETRSPAQETPISGPETGGLESAEIKPYILRMDCEK